MTNELWVAVISTSGSVIVGIAGLLVTGNQISKRIDRIEHKLDIIEANLKQFYKDIIQIKQKIGLD